MENTYNSEVKELSTLIHTLVKELGEVAEVEFVATNTLLQVIENGRFIEVTANGFGHDLLFRSGSCAPIAEIDADYVILDIADKMPITHEILVRNGCKTLANDNIKLIDDPVGRQTLVLEDGKLTRVIERAGIPATHRGIITVGYVQDGVLYSADRHLAHEVSRKNRLGYVIDLDSGFECRDVGTHEPDLLSEFTIKYIEFTTSDVVTLRPIDLVVPTPAENHKLGIPVRLTHRNFGNQY